MKLFVSALLLSALCLAGCSSVGKLGGVTATPLQVRVISPTEAHVTLRLDNENVVALGLESSTHKLSLNGTYVAQGESKVPIGLVAMTSASQDVTFKIENPAVIRGLGNASTAPYSIDSVLKLTSGENRFEFKSHSEGTLSISGTENAK